GRTRRSRLLLTADGLCLLQESLPLWPRDALRCVISGHAAQNVSGGGEANLHDGVLTVKDFRACLTNQPVSGCTVAAASRPRRYASWGSHRQLSGEPLLDIGPQRRRQERPIVANRVPGVDAVPVDAASDVDEGEGEGDAGDAGIPKEQQVVEGHV